MLPPILKAQKMGINKNINIQYYEKPTVRDSCFNSFEVNWTKPRAEKSGLNSQTNCTNHKLRNASLL